MEITDEQLENYRQKHEAEQQESYRLGELVVKYKSMIKSNMLYIKIDWETDIKNIDLDPLNANLVPEIENNIKTDYEIVVLDLDKVVNRHTSNADEVYPKNDAWGDRHPYKVAKLIEFVCSGKKVIPPLIQPTDLKTLLVFDGNHRIALSRFLKLKTIPFIVAKKYLHNIVGLQ